MAKKAVIAAELNLNTNSAEKEIKSLTDEISKLREELSSTSEGTEEYIDKLDKLKDAEKKLEGAQDKLNKSLADNQKESKKSATSGKGLMDVIKGLGVVTAISAGFEIFKEALMKNQKVADGVATVMTTISNVMSAFIEIVTQVVDRVGKSTNGFEALGKVVMGAINLAFTPLKLTFYAIKLVLEEAQLAWEESFFGDGNPTVIKDLNKRIGETKDSIKTAADDAVKSGKDIYNNFGEAAKSVGDVINGVIDESSKINVKAIYENAKATTALQNSAKIAAAQLQGLVEKYDRQAETLRQIRDDENKSIDERIKANEDLGKVLDEQKKSMLSLADVKIKAAQVELSANRTNIELQTNLQNALNERAGVLAQITGLESEQKVNAVALGKELIELNKMRSQSEAQLLLEKRKANAELITDELAKQIELQKIRDEERKSEIARLEENVKNTKEGTQARLDAEIELNTKKQELDIADENAKKEIDKIKNQRALDLKNSQIENALSEYNIKKGLIEKLKIDEAEKSRRLVELAIEERDKLIEQINLKRDAEIAAAEKQGLDITAIKEKYRLQTEQINNNIFQSEKDLEEKKIATKRKALDDLQTIFGTETAMGKALLIAKQALALQEMIQSARSTLFKAKDAATKATIDASSAQVSVAAGAAKTSGSVPFPANIPLIIGYAVQAIGIISAVRAALRGVKGATMPGVTNPVANTAAVSAPIAPQAQVTRLDQAQINQIGNAAGRAYVLESDISSGQERINRLNRAARIN